LEDASERYLEQEGPKAVREAIKQMVSLAPRRVLGMMEYPKFTKASGRVSITREASDEHDAEIILNAHVEENRYGEVDLFVDYELSVGRWHTDRSEIDRAAFDEDDPPPSGEELADAAVHMLARHLKAAFQQFERELG